jgi:radical SAM superfamily enzyme YgiQ (UPF0313 family)
MKNGRKKILLCSIFKPCGVDDLYGRKENIAELFHNQLTLYQGTYSMRQRFPSFGLHLIACNITHPTVILDWPTLDRFKAELKKGYDIIGISFIQTNLNKARKMVEVAREISPHSKIVLGGFGVTTDNIESLIEADYFCRGEGITFMRKLLNEDGGFNFKHPVVGVKTIRIMGVPLNVYQGVIVSGLGCDYGCDFCSSSHFFDCRRLEFLKTGEDVFNEMERQNRLVGATSFSLVGDENFFVNYKRARELRDCIVKSGKTYSISLAFGSADTLAKIDPVELAEMGLNTVWIGVESQMKIYNKNKSVNMKELVSELNRWGIKTILSSILCLECHTKENIYEDIEYHISLNPTYSQFGLLSPAANTPLWKKMKKEGRILNEIPIEDRHAMKYIWFRHPEFTPYEAERIQRYAYMREFEVLGPSLVRWIRVNFQAYNSFLKTNSEILKKRAELLRKNFKYYKIVLKAIEKTVPFSHMREMARELRREIELVDGKLTIVESALSGVLTFVTEYDKLKTRLFKDVIQPKTELTYYNF